MEIVIKVVLTRCTKEQALDLGEYLKDLIYDDQEDTGQVEDVSYDISE